MFAAALCALSFAPHVRAAANITWAPYRASILRIDDEPPKSWNIYYDTHAKGNDMLLLQWGDRYLRINSKLKTVHEMDPATFTHEKDKLVSPADESTGKLLVSAGWIARDVGSADRVYFELSDEGHKVDINLPHGGR